MVWEGLGAGAGEERGVPMYFWDEIGGAALEVNEVVIFLLKWLA